MTPFTIGSSEEVLATGDVVLLEFPFTNARDSKRRPALVIREDEDGDVLCARITTRIHAGPFDIPIEDWQGAGLLAPSEARIHKLATLDVSLILRKLGALSQRDAVATRERFQMLANIEWPAGA